MKILKPKKLACLIYGHSCKMSDIKYHYVGNGMYECVHTCMRCGTQTRYEMSENDLGLPPRREEDQP